MKVTDKLENLKNHMGAEFMNQAFSEGLSASPCSAREITFTDFAEITRSEDGVYHAECPFGFWSVSGENLLAVACEAQHYFVQYEEDGEYAHYPKRVSASQMLAKIKQNVQSVARREAAL